MDSVEEIVGQYRHLPGPTTLERFVPELFKLWLDDTREMETTRTRGGGEPTGELKALGSQVEEAWEQWRDYVDELNDDPDF